jgi:SAM-dependent methyltransferase
MAMADDVDQMEKGLEKYLRNAEFPDATIAEILSQISSEGNLRYEYERLFLGRGSLRLNPETADPSPETRRGFGFERSQKTARVLYGIKLASDRRDFRVLNVGCGDGWSMAAYDSQGLDCVGIDLSRIAVELSKHGKVREEMAPLSDGSEMKTYRIVYDPNISRDATVGNVGELYKTGLGEDEFDAVVDEGRLMMQPWVKKMFKAGGSQDNMQMCLNDLLQIKRVLKPGGYLLLVTASDKFLEREPEYANLAKAKLEELLNQARYEKLNFAILENGAFFKYDLRNEK